MHTRHHIVNTEDLVRRLLRMEDAIRSSKLDNYQVRSTAKFKFLDRLGSLLMKADATNVALAAPSFPIVFGATRIADMFTTTSTSFEQIAEATFTMWNPNAFVGGYGAATAGTTGEVRIIQKMEDDSTIIGPIANITADTGSPARWWLDFGLINSGSAGAVATIGIQLRRTTGGGTVYASIVECRTNSYEVTEVSI